MKRDSGISAGIFIRGISISSSFKKKSNAKPLTSGGEALKG
jgi:hypothetical protein